MCSHRNKVSRIVLPYKWIEGVSFLWFYYLIPAWSIKFLLNFQYLMVHVVSVQVVVVQLQLKMSFRICMKIIFIKFYPLSLPPIHVFVLSIHADSIIIFHSTYLRTHTHNFLGTRLNKRSVSNLFVLLCMCVLRCALANILLPCQNKKKCWMKKCVVSQYNMGVCMRGDSI